MVNVCISSTTERSIRPPYSCLMPLNQGNSSQSQSHGLQMFSFGLYSTSKRGRGRRCSLVTPPCLPVQTASLDPIRFQDWDKKFTPLHAGMPLWTCDELAQGCVLLFSCFFPHINSQDTVCHIRDDTTPFGCASQGL